MSRFVDFLFLTKYQKWINSILWLLKNQHDYQKVFNQSYNAKNNFFNWYDRIMDRIIIWECRIGKIKSINNIKKLRKGIYGNLF